MSTAVQIAASSVALGACWGLAFASFLDRSWLVGGIQVALGAINLWPLLPQLVAAGAA